MNPLALLKILLGTMLVLFCGILFVLAFHAPLGGAFTFLLGLALLVFARRKAEEIDRILRLLLLPLFGSGGRPRATEGGPVFSFLDIELDRRERTAAAAACMAAACAHVARIQGGRTSERGKVALAEALRHNFGLAYDGEWIAYVWGRTDSLLAGMDARSAREASLDEIIGLCLGMLPARRQPGTLRETRALLFALVYQALLIDGARVGGEEFFDALGRRHGLTAGEIEANKAAGRYYLHAFRHGGKDRSNATGAGEGRRRQQAGQQAGAKGDGAHANGQASAGGASTIEADGELLRLFQLKPNYNERSLERAWKRILHSYHPDRHHDGDEGSRRAAHERFLRMKRAYETLRSKLETAQAL